MGNFSKLLEQDEKKLDISGFIPDNAKETDENGQIVNDYWITIKKLSRIVKTKIRFLNQNMFHGDKGKEVFKIIQKKMKEKGIKNKNLEEMTPEEQLDMMISFNLDVEDYNYMGKNTAEIEKYYLEFGVDQNKHSLTNDKGKKIVIDSKFWDLVPDSLVSFVVSNIRSYSKSFSLGE